ncbi:hypothetical protein [Wolbachia endosymbiont (group A) of Oxytorus armatus]|uniref:hypothetical protein n=1 Tax=Wolbachia endosymbiont (group A) of Oxytorus armatus TaxID=3066211 RepID=UPI003132D36A
MTISFREYSTVFTEVAEQTDLNGNNIIERIKGISIDPANKQRDDGCQGVRLVPSLVIPVPRHWDPEKFACSQAN